MTIPEKYTGGVGEKRWQLIWGICLVLYPKK